MQLKKTYQENFIYGMKVWMAKNEVENIKDAADHFEINYMALYKVMDGTNNPTIELCVSLCKRAGYSANWLFLNKGEMILKKQENINGMIKSIAELKDIIMPKNRPKKMPG